jgi:hypothetical protein
MIATHDDDHDEELESALRRIEGQWSDSVGPRQARTIRRRRFRVLPGYGAPRPVRKRKIAAWLNFGMTGAEANGWKGIPQRFAFIAFEMGCESGWGKRGHAGFVATLDGIASKSPELLSATTGRSRIGARPIPFAPPSPSARPSGSWSPLRSSCAADRRPPRGRRLAALSLLF